MSFMLGVVVFSRGGGGCESMDATRALCEGKTAADRTGSGYASSAR